MGFGHILRAKRMELHLSQEMLAEALGISPKSISRWEQEQTIPQAHYQLLLSRFFGVQPEELFKDLISKASALIWTVPFPRNTNFCGREEILQQLHTLLTVEQPVVLTQASALAGLGGIGKTQAAIEYAYRYGQEYCAVLWLAAETAESLMASLQKISDQLQLPERQAVEQSQMVEAVQKWLMTHPGWLLIVDNVENLDLVQSILPPVRPGALLLTTRRRALGPLAAPLELPAMNGQDGVDLLLRRAGLLRFQAQSVESLSEISLSPVRDLVTLLEGLPLALDQAGAYIEESGCGVADYLQRCRDQRKMVLERRGTHGGAHPASVSTTLKLSVEQTERESPAAADLLRVCAFLHPEAIPEEMFAAGASFLGPVLGPVVDDPYQFDLAVAALRNASLITRHPETRTLSVHRLVQAVLQDQMEPADALQWGSVVVRMVNAAFPESEFDTWTQCERCLAQALACIPLIKRAEARQPEAGELLYKAGSYLLERGRLGEAESLLEQAVMLEECLYGSQHPNLISHLEKLAELFWRQGKYTLTESILYRVLALEEEHMGHDHFRRAETLNNLAALYVRQGRYEEAEPLFQQALRTQEQQLGPEHLEIATTLNNLASLYQRQGKYEQTEELNQRALSIREQQLPPEHPLMAVSLHNLASLYRRQAKYEQAESLYQRVVRIREQQLGSEHLETAFSLHNLADLYQKQKKYELAESLYQRTLHIREQQLGPEHPETAFTLNGLARLYGEQEKYEFAERLHRRALRIQEQQLRPEHPETATTLHDLANLYRKQGKYELAEPLYQRTLQIREQQLSTGHPETATTLHQLASLYRQLGQLERAESLYLQALTIYEQQPGPEHPDMKEIRDDYRSLLNERKSTGEVEVGVDGEQRGSVSDSPGGTRHEQGILHTSMKKEAATWLETDSLQRFLAARCELHPQAWSRASELWKAYRCWADEQQERFPLTRRAFTDQLKVHGCHSHRTNTARIWRGIAVVK